MKYRYIKTILSLFLLLLSVVASAQEVADGGVKGRIVSRTARKSLENVKVTLSPGNIETKSDVNGVFEIHNLEKGEYTLSFDLADFEPLSLSVRVEKLVREISVVLISDIGSKTNIDDAVFTEFDSETVNGGQSLPSSLSASKDVFNNIASYQFSKVRFNVRGYDSQYSDIFLNGIRFNDAMTGYTPWSLWSGLNDATRNQEITTGLNMSHVGVGGVGGTTNINIRPSLMRKGFRGSLVNANSTYRFRGMMTYASGLRDDGWAYALSLSTRQGGNDYVDGVYYNAFSYFAAIEKQIDNQHNLSFHFLGAPTERGVQQASTQEVYDLIGTNYYNPNWGWQDGKRRNARVRRLHEPIAMLNYSYDINERTNLNVASSFRFGQNGYSALSWHAGSDPRPDYYRNLPSFYKGTSTGAWLQEAWMGATENTNNIRHIDWGKLYDINRNQEEDLKYGTGHRSINIIEERHTDQRDFNLNVRFSQLFKDNSKLTQGINFRRNRTEWYNEIKDLMGGDYWVDVDKFAERDMGITNPVPYQNNMDYYEKYGKAPIAKEGDKFGYDYYANVVDVNVWMQYYFNIGGLETTLGGELGHNSLWREGIWKKGLFLNYSQGSSEKQRYQTYKLKSNFKYKISGGHTLEANMAYTQDAPNFQYAFVSPRTRNTATPGVSTEKIFGVDATYALRLGGVKFRLTGYYTTFKDLSKVISYYDDVESTFSNFAMSGVDKQHMGVEAALSVPIYAGLSVNGALSWGEYTYTSNPDYIQTQDNSGEIKSEGQVYWKNFYVESTPQIAANLGLSYRGPNNIFASIDGNFYDRTYLSMNPIYRTDAVLTPGMTPEDIAEIRSQEKFRQSFVLNASIGKNWYINRSYTIGFSLSGDNLLNNKKVKTGGYEQIRLLKNKEESFQTYQPFDSKYFYLFGTTYYLNVYFRF